MCHLFRFEYKASDGIGRLRSIFQPFCVFFPVYRECVACTERIVVADRIAEPAIPFASGFGNNDAVLRLAFLADAGKSDF